MRKRNYYYEQAYAIPLYRGDLIIIITNSIDKLYEQFTDIEFNELYAHSIYNNYDGGSGYFMVLNFDSEHRNIMHGTISHEASHLAGMILKHRGVISDFDNDEPFTYLVEWITDIAYKVIDEYKFKVAQNRL
jgi:hypothetical protein